MQEVWSVRRVIFIKVDVLSLCCSLLSLRLISSLSLFPRLWMLQPFIPLSGALLDARSTCERGARQIGQLEGAGITSFPSRHLLALLGETLRVRSRRLRVQIRRGLTARQSTNIRFYNYVHERRGRKVFAPREQREHVTWREYTPPTVNAESVIAPQRRVALIARKQMCAMYVCLSLFRSRKLPRKFHH